MKTEPLAASGESSERGGPGEEAGEDRHADAGRRVPVIPCVVAEEYKNHSLTHRFRGSTDCQ